MAPCVLLTLAITLLADPARSSRYFGASHRATAGSGARWPDVGDERAIPSVAALPPQLLRGVLRYAPRPVQVASSLRGVPSLWGHGATTRLSGFEGRAVDLKFFPGGDRLLVRGDSGSVEVWSALSGRRLRQIGTLHGPRVLDAQIFPEGDRVVTLAADHRALIWNASSGILLTIVELWGSEPPREVRVLPGGDRILTGISGGFVDNTAVWNATTGSLIERFATEGKPRVFALSPCGEKLVTLSISPASDLLVWDIATGTLERSLAAAVRAPTAITTSEGARTVAVSTAAGDVRVFRGDELSWSTVESRGVVDVAILPRRDRLLVATDEAVSIFDTNSGARLAELDTQGGGIERIAVGQRFVAACGSPASWGARSRSIVWDGRTGKRLITVVGPEVASETEEWPCVVAVGPSGALSDWSLA